MNVLIPGT